MESSLATNAVDVVVGGFSLLNAPEREAAFARIREMQLRAAAHHDNEMERHIDSLRRVAEHVGRIPAPADYRAAYKELRAMGEEVIEINALIRFFGRWSLAKESLELSAFTTPAKIRARFRSRLVGKVHRYGEEQLKQTLLTCARALDRPPLIVEYKAWRDREVELAKTRGEELWLPSDSPFRRRWGSWEGALKAVGFSDEAIERRLGPGAERALENLQPFQYRASADN